MQLFTTPTTLQHYTTFVMNNGLYDVSGLTNNAFIDTLLRIFRDQGT
jgi:hypothetical protein